MDWIHSKRSPKKRRRFELEARIVELKLLQHLGDNKAITVCDAPTCIVNYHEGGPILSHGSFQTTVDPNELHKGLVRFLHEYTQTYVEDLWNVLQSAPYGDGPANLPLVSSQRSLSLAHAIKDDAVFLWHTICYTSS